MRHFLTACLVGGVLAVPQPARAELSPQDVWANLQAVATAIGGRMSGRLSESGAVFSATDITVDFALPMGAGSVTLDMGTITFTGQGDGSVALGGPEAQEIVLRIDIAQEGGAAVTMNYAVQDYAAVARGDPGDVTYDWQAGGYSITVEDIDLTGKISEEAGELIVDGVIELTGTRGTYRVVAGEDLLTITQDGAIDGGEIELSYEFRAPDDGSVRSGMTATMGPATGTAEARLPLRGTSLMALAGALRDGLFLAYSYDVGPQTSEQVTYLDGELMMSQSDAIERIVGDMTVDADGLRASATVTGYDLALEEPLVIPVPVSLQLDTMEIAVAVPLLQREEPQKLTLRTLFENVTVDPALWALIDPGAQLPRDPARLALDMLMDLRLDIDLVDFGALMALDQGGEVPGEILSLTLTELAAAAAGVEAEMTGAVTFDHSDYTTFDGLPAMDGSARIVLRGVDALLDRLQEMGLASEDDIRGARLFLGGFTRPGERAEERVSEIEIDGAEGTVTANGQRIK